jgi:hypothetical protein
MLPEPPGTSTMFVWRAALLLFFMSSSLYERTAWLG